jgi:hypothetical protein
MHTKWIGHVPLQSRFAVVPELEMYGHARDNHGHQGREARDNKDKCRQLRASTTDHCGQVDKGNGGNESTL